MVNYLIQDDSDGSGGSLLPVCDFVGGAWVIRKISLDGISTALRNLWGASGFYMNGGIYMEYTGSAAYSVQIDNKIASGSFKIRNYDNGKIALIMDDETGLRRILLGPTTPSYFNFATNFGIGTTNPLELFHVAGTIRQDLTTLSTAYKAYNQLGNIAYQFGRNSLGGGQIIVNNNLGILASRLDAGLYLTGNITFSDTYGSTNAFLSNFASLASYANDAAAIAAGLSSGRFYYNTTLRSICRVL